MGLCFCAHCCLSNKEDVLFSVISRRLNLFRGVHLKKAFPSCPCRCASIPQKQPAVGEGPTLRCPLAGRSRGRCIFLLLCNRFSPSGLSDSTDDTFLVFSPGVKERNSVSPLTDFDIPTSFWYELKSLTEALMDNVKRELLFAKHFLLITGGCTPHVTMNCPATCRTNAASFQAVQAETSK